MVSTDAYFYIRSKSSRESPSNSVGIPYINRKERWRSASGYTIRIHSPKALSGQVECLKKMRDDQSNNNRELVKEERTGPARNFWGH